jgi:hypothetical protein
MKKIKHGMQILLKCSPGFRKKHDETLANLKDKIIFDAGCGTGF